VVSEQTRTEILQYAWVFGALPLLWLSVVLILMTPFWRSVVGTHLLVKTLLLAAILSFSALRYYVGDLPSWVEWIRWVIYMLFPPVILWRVVLQVQGLREHRRATT
jgi:hypothetical protein